MLCVEGDITVSELKDLIYQLPDISKQVRRVLASYVNKAAYNDNFDVVKYIVEEFLDVYDINEFSNIRTSVKLHTTLYPIEVTLFMAACNSGNLDMLRYLVSKGANASCQESSVWGSLLIFAVSCTKLGKPIIQYLVDQGGKMNGVIDDMGRSPLMVACLSDHPGTDVVEYLLAQGADPLHKSYEGYTAMHMAAAGGRLDLVKLLYTHGIKVLYTAGTSNPLCTEYVPCPLYLAAVEDHVHVMTYLVSLPECTILCRAEAYLLQAAWRIMKHPVKNVWDKERESWEGCLTKGLEILEQVGSLKSAYPVQIAEYGFRKEYSSKNEYLAFLDSEDFLEIEVNYQAFMIVERCLGIWFMSHCNTYYNISFLIARRAMEFITLKTISEIEIEALWQRAAKAWLLRYQIISHFGMSMRMWKKFLMFNLNAHTDGVKSLMKDREGYIPQFQHYIRFALEALNIIITNLKENRHGGTQIQYRIINKIFHLFLMWILSFINKVEESSVPKEFDELGYELVSMFLYLPPGYTLLHMRCALVLPYLIVLMMLLSTCLNSSYRGEEKM